MAKDKIVIDEGYYPEYEELEEEEDEFEICEWYELPCGYGYDCINCPHYWNILEECSMEEYEE